MNKIIIVFCAILFCSFTSDENKVEEMLTSGKWFVESVQEIGEEPEMVADKNEEWIIFHKEGKVEENLFGETTNSKWEYSEENKSIKIVGNEIVYKKIIEISNDKLIVELLENVNTEHGLMVTYIK